jgi:acyl-CoA reductase-like NAD-dependent aldehyde dehydrogenase
MLQQTLSPIDGHVVAERELATDAAIDRALAAAVRAQRHWREVPVEERARVLTAFCDAFEARRAAIAAEITLQIGRPTRYAPSEVSGTLERARYMIDIAPAALADVDPGPKVGFRRFIRREPLGVVLTIAAWNYPCLIAVNSVVPALLAGNAVLLKHSAQTPLSAERFAECLEVAGLPAGLLTVLHMTHPSTERAIADPRVAFVAFTGSVEGGHAVQRAIAGRFAGTGLELGGCDPAYVRADADLDDAVENLVDGAYFNSGQSCCGIQRVYVDERVYDRFVDAWIDATRRYVLGDPRDTTTTLGPVVRASAAAVIRKQVAATVAAGATAAIDARDFPEDRPGSAYVAPQVLLDVDHTMPVMREEIFGPVAGIMKVRSDDDAVALMNDSRYGLTAAVWSRDTEAALAIGEHIETGTFFVNRCDYLDPALAWVGVRDSGRGCTLSRIGYEHLTRPKSFHVRLARG